jgi:hypothetical protein
VRRLYFVFSQTLVNFSRINHRTKENIYKFLSINNEYLRNELQCCIGSFFLTGYHQIKKKNFPPFFLLFLQVHNLPDMKDTGFIPYINQLPKDQENCMKNDNIPFDKIRYSELHHEERDPYR